MGLIKTAIYTGAGLYAINKVAKIAETHSNNRSSSQTRRDDQNRAYGGQPACQQQAQGSPLQFRDLNDGHHENYQQQQQQQQPMYLTNDPAYALPYPYGDYQGRPTYESAAPRYVSPQRQGFVEPEEALDHEPSRGGQPGGHDQLNNLIQQAMGYAKSGGKDGDSTSKGQKLLSQLLSK